MSNIKKCIFMRVLVFIILNKIFKRSKSNIKIIIIYPSLPKLIAFIEK